MMYYQNNETGELFDSATAARKDFRDNYDGDDPTNCVRFWDLYTEVSIPVTYMIRGYEEERVEVLPEEYMRKWFEDAGYTGLSPKLIFNQSQANDYGYKTTVYVWRYATLYTETFIFEEREY